MSLPYRIQMDAWIPQNVFSVTRAEVR